MFDMIAFDADDTLWHNEAVYSETQDKVKKILLQYQLEPGRIEQVLYEKDAGNVNYFGYGVKSFTLSMIEAAVELTEGKIPGQEIQQIINYAKEMLAAEVHLLDHVEDTLAELAHSHDLMMITKGDLLDQELKVARSGLADYFKSIEIISEKTAESYRDILARHQLQPGRFLMVGNSLKSDIWPVLAIGGRAVYVPQALTWAYEVGMAPDGDQDGYFELEHLGQLPALVEQLSRA